VTSTVGYTGGTRPNPTYRSVCGGDGHTEAVRVCFDPKVISYESLIKRVISEADPHGWGGNQYKSAVWAQDAEQMDIAKNVAIKLGKPNVPILEKMPWTDAEDYHQKYIAKARR